MVKHATKSLLTNTGAVMAPVNLNYYEHEKNRSTNVYYCW